MRGKRAKAIRKVVYGDVPISTREYAYDRMVGGMVNMGLRRIYLKTKKEYTKNR